MLILREEVKKYAMKNSNLIIQLTFLKIISFVIWGVKELAC